MSTCSQAEAGRSPEGGMIWGRETAMANLRWLRYRSVIHVS
jgi:hypothetical protein